MFMLDSPILRESRMNRLVVLLVVVALTFVTPRASTASTSDPQQFCIVLDPGHGGRDSGSIGINGLREKTVALDIAQRLSRLLTTNLHARVVLTRRGDYYVSLEERATEANRAKGGTPADLLISIHVNACMERTVNGFQVFYASKRHELGLDEIIQIDDTGTERREFRTGYGEVAKSARWDSQYSKHTEANKMLASSVADALENRLAMPRLQTAPAVLRLLRGLDMPALLVEIGFMSNGSSEAMLSTEEFQDTCAQALLEGIMDYRKAMLDRVSFER
jgi:N-acetylmuramoyl-L-alanine amidase